MVQSTKTGIFHLESEAAMGRSKQPVRMEVDDYMESQYGRDYKRSRISSDSLQVQQSMVGNTYPVPPQQYNPLDEPSPLGLKLKKSPSLVEMIQKHLAQGHGNAAKPENSSETISSDQKESKNLATNSDKLKASNIPAKLLRIGNWEYQSMYEGDLVAKCYFAKHKLVWEVLESGLKSKIEIQWSDITGLKADYPEFGESSLRLMLARQPLFFRETNPQPRKHTLRQPCSDFTNGEASLNRFHFLKFPQGMLQKHYEKLIQSDNRLNLLSRQPGMLVDPPYFESSLSSVFEEAKSHFFNPVKAGESSLSPDFPDATLPTATTAIQPSIFKIELQGHGGKILEQLPRESFSPNSVMAVNPTEGFMNQIGESQGVRKSSIGRFEEPTAGVRPSMSKLDILNCLGNMIVPVADAPRHMAQLENLAEYLLNDSDSLVPLPTDENSLMARVNSLCCLLEKDNVEGSNSLKESQCDTSVNPTTVAMNHNKENPQGVIFNPKPSVFESLCASGGEEPEENLSMKPATGMMKKDSFSDLLLNLPRIASLPKFMNFSENNENHFN